MAYALRAPDRIVKRAADLGSNVEAFATRLLDGPLSWAKLRQGQKLLSLSEKYSGERLDGPVPVPSTWLMFVASTASSSGLPVTA